MLPMYIESGLASYNEFGTCSLISLRLLVTYNYFLKKHQLNQVVQNFPWLKKLCDFHINYEKFKAILCAKLVPQANFVPKIQYSQGNCQILCLRLAFFLTSIWLKQVIAGEASSFSSTRIMLQILPCQKQQLQKCIAT